MRQRAGSAGFKSFNTALSGSLLWAAVRCQPFTAVRCQPFTALRCQLFTVLRCQLKPPALAVNLSRRPRTSIDRRLRRSEPCLRQGNGEGPYRFMFCGKGVAVGGGYDNFVSSRCKGFILRIGCLSGNHKGNGGNPLFFLS